jgi:hypothetical protein
LVSSALERVAVAIVKGHECCSASGTARLQTLAAKFAEGTVAAKLTDNTAHHSTWDHKALLSFLYPVVVALPDGWALAPYSLEWCAENEWRLHNNPKAETPQPQREILTLLQQKPLEKLAALAKETGWELGAVYLNLAMTAETLDTETSRKMIDGTLRAARSHLSSVQPATIAAAAATFHLHSMESSTTKMPAWMNLGKAMRAISAHRKVYSLCGTYNWFVLLGTELGSDRSPEHLISQFVCKPEVNPETLREGIRRQARAFVNIMYGVLGPPGAQDFVAGRPRVTPKMLRVLTANPDENEDTEDEMPQLLDA